MLIKIINKIVIINIEIKKLAIKNKIIFIKKYGSVIFL